MIKKIFEILTKKEQIHFFGILVFVLIMALLDVIGVASILPFIALISNPEIIETNKFLSTFYTFFSFENYLDFTLAFGLLVFILLVFSLLFKAFTIYLQLRFSLMNEYNMCKQLVEGYLNQPYSWILDRNSSEITKTILSEVSSVTNGCVLPLMSLITQSAVVISIVVMLLFIDPFLAVSVSLIFGLSYSFIFIIIRGYLVKIGNERFIANKFRFSIISEAFGAFKQIKVSGLESIFLSKFSKPAKIFAKHETTASIMKQLPRYGLEIITFGGMMLIILYMINQKGAFIEAIPIIALYAFAGYRVMPALQQIYSSITQLKYINPVFHSVHKDITQLKINNPNENKNKFNFKNKITLKDLSYTYPNTSKKTLNKLNIEIPYNKQIGFVGVTGSGKTTTVDLILGLLKPQEGSIIIDDKQINQSNIRSWQSILGYVPQQIYLSDDSIKSNIAFGIEEKDINISAVEEAAKIADIYEFIKNELNEGFNTLVGERGVRLSGGQRQRIGIARALYNKPKVLILDEATTALDNLTEKSVIESLQKMDYGITTISIAHRLSTIQNCDNIFLFENGEIIGSGNYKSLLKSSEKFKRLASTNEDQNQIYKS